MPFNTTINANGMSINPALLLTLFSKSDLHWEMHSAQLLSLDIMAMQNSTTIELSDEKSVYIVLPRATVTLFGFPVKVDNDKYPKGLIRLMWGDREVGRIEALAVPIGYPGLPDFDLEQKSEKEKFQKLTY